MASPPKQLFNYCRIIPVVIFLFVFQGISHAQIVTPSVVNTNGFTKNMADGFITISIGELAVQTLIGLRGIITQGFLQPELQPPCLDFELDYYPNPVYDFLTIRDTACGKIINEIEVFDLLGNQVLRTRLISQEADLRLLGVGVFIIRGYSVVGEALGIFKIIKIEGQ